MSQSKLEFEKTIAKNFRSVGNMPLEFNYLDSARKLVISSENGDGKSTMSLQALFYCLFDKAYDKGCTKTSLVNTRSNKDCLVEAYFRTKGSSWVVRRGMKPSVFDIIKDGQRVEDEAALADYQKYLEETVLGFDEKAFQNTVALGKDKFVPFVEMDAATRRTYVEQMLDSAVFTKMAEETKDSAKLLKAELETLRHKTANAESRLSMNKTRLTEYDQQVARAENQIGDEIKGIQVKIDEVTEQRNRVIEEGMKILTDIEAMKAPDIDQLNKSQTMIHQARARIADLEKSSNSVTGLTTCPTCKQEVGEDHKHAVKGDSDRQLGVLRPGLQRLEETVKNLSQQASEMESYRQAALQKRNQGTTLGDTIKQLQDSVSRLQAMAANAKDDNKRNEITKAIDEVGVELEGLRTNAVEAETDLNAHLYLISALKDDGAKAQYVKEYLPFLNEKINTYLDALGLFVNVTLDEEFGVTMYAPDRKGQTISNLSTGQKCRVNLAILLAWRDLARVKCSVDTNILIMDEVLENLSAQGVTDFMEMMEKTGQGVNLVVISQRNQEFAELFDDVVYYTTKDGFQVQEER